MDDKKKVKEFVNHICDWIEYEYKTKNHIGFSCTLSNNRMSYIIADKGIEKRISKELYKRLRINSTVSCTQTAPVNEYLDGEIKIKLILNDWREYEYVGRIL